MSVSTYAPLRRTTRWLAGSLSLCLGMAAGSCTTNTPADTTDLAALTADLAVGASGDGSTVSDLAGKASMSFFIASEKGSANLGGLAGADARCDRLAKAAGVTGKKWAAYLSVYADNGAPAVNARDRIGKGPWYNAKGDKIASSVQELHSATNNLNKTTALNENGAVIPGRGDPVNEHDLLTGSNADGTVNAMATCRNWTSEMDGVAGVNAAVGHHDRQGGGADPMSWNAAHTTPGCSATSLVSVGGAGHIYCFEVN